MRDIVRQLDLGNSVAEFDEALDQYFVETETFRTLIRGDADVIAGDKGTGKTALFRILQRRYTTLRELAKVEIITGFNPSGNPVFQRLAQQQVLTEGQYATVWKAYVLSLVGNWLLDLYEGAFTDSMRELDELLRRTGLRSADDSAQTIFSKIANYVTRFLRPSAAEVGFTLSEVGIPVITPKVHFSDEPESGAAPETVPHEDALRLLNSCLTDADVSVWMVLDRLDEAFQGFPDTEVPALRALFRTYLDLLEFDHIRLKLFVRRDLFRKITEGGFVNLTHVNARKVEIVWDEDDLFNLLCRRLRESDGLIRSLDLGDDSDDAIFNAVFPHQVDVGDRKPTAWNWMMSRIRDGNGLKPPRNLIDLVSKAKEAQLRREEREGREFDSGTPLLESDSIRRALGRLSAERVEDTLLAEAGDYSRFVEKFRGNKAEHNANSLADLLDINESTVKAEVKPLVDLGFLEITGETYRVPILYRSGLEVTQGKAF